MAKYETTIVGKFEKVVNVGLSSGRAEQMGQYSV